MEEEFFEGLVEDVGPESRRPHHEHFDNALQQAIDQIPADAPQWFTVEASVFVKHESPGWIDGYRIRLSPGGG
jgi:hypothetical protein